MDIRQLQYFIEVARQSSFSKASGRLHVTQPTLSKMLKNLEDELGVTLIDRSTRRMQLTEAGQVVLRHAQTMMKTIEDMYSELEDLSKKMKGKIVFGLPPVVGASFFPKMIARFHELYPEISIQLVEEGGKTMEHLLLEGDIDLGVAILPVNEEHFEVLPLVERDLFMIAHPGHPLTRKPEVKLTDLKGEPVIMFRRGFAVYDRVREACIREGFEPEIAFESSQWDFISELVAANFGISFMPETVCDKLDTRQITVIRSYSPKIKWQLGLIWRKNKYLSHAAKRWIRYVQQEFPRTEIRYRIQN